MHFFAKIKGIDIQHQDISSQNIQHKVEEYVFE